MTPAVVVLSILAFFVGAVVGCLALYWQIERLERR